MQIHHSGHILRSVRKETGGSHRTSTVRDPPLEASVPQQSHDEGPSTLLSP